MKIEKKDWRQNIVKIRNLIQVIFAMFLLYAGWQFYRFVLHFKTGGKTEYVVRPSAVDGFLPLSALLSLKKLIITGVFDSVHPAALVLLLAIILISILFKKGFCSWLCPISTISEALGRFGEMIFGDTFELPKVLDWLLMVPKYLLLAFFIKAVFFDMSIQAVTDFLRSPYNLIVDVKMLYFFLDLSFFTVKVLIFLTVASILIKNFWCRYLCPYGALLGIVSLVSPIKITRKEENCIECGLCTKACPNQVRVHKQERVHSPECDACLNCLKDCPRSDKALNLSVYKWNDLPVALYPVLLLGVFLLIVTIAKMTGHWETGITTEMYKELIPKVKYFNH